MIDEEKVKLPSYSGVWMPWNRRKLTDGTIVFKVIDLENGPAIIIDNHWDTVVRIILPNKKAQKRLYWANCQTGEELIKTILLSEREAFVFEPLQESFDFGDRVWLLLNNMKKIESTRLEILHDGNIKNYETDEIYKKEDVLVIQRRIPYALIDDPKFMEFLGR